MAAPGPSAGAGSRTAAAREADLRLAECVRAQAPLRRVLARIAGGSDELANRTTLCAWHHLRGVHAGLMRCLGEAPDNLVFELGVRPGRPPLVRYSAERRILSSGVPGFQAGIV